MAQFLGAIARLGRPKLAVWLVLAASGCQVIAGLTERSVGLAPCLHNSDCASDQACLFRVCAPRCIQDVDCENGRCLDTESGNACVSASQATCAGGEECPTGSICSGGSCRTPCDQSDPCRSDQVCTEDLVCVGTDSNHDPEAPPSSMGGSGGTGDKGGSSSGGLNGDSGAPAEGGSATGGSGGSGMGGNGGSQVAGGGGSGGGGNGGSAGGGGGDSDPSTGCNSAPALSTGTRTLMSSAMQRTYHLDVPANYAQSTPYRLIIGWHWLNTTGAKIADGTAGPAGGPFYGLKALATEGAIFVAPEAIGGNWSGNRSAELQFVRDLVAQLEAGLCIDRGRIFSVGFSLGGAMSAAVGCSMGDVFRAVAVMSGNKQLVGCEAGTTPIAYWASHGTDDQTITYNQGVMARDEFVTRNGCSDQTEAVEPAGCVAYQGCTAGHPLHWCEFDGDHAMPPFAAQGTWSFFSQF